MCVGLPARVDLIKEGMAIVDATGVKRRISTELIRDLNPGDYVMVHAGVAIAKINGKDDEETDSLLENLDAE
ncbi:MAG: HypC/HybG/HupF family hydrogenase formation chaperone [Treponema sp.]|nr:HypC/HybG/HupF family hydrogenase formation chaperone [Treponema sp.]